MSFRDLQFNSEYRSGKSDVIKDFFIPSLSDAVLYKRAVGFFSSSALIQIAKGIGRLVENGGRIELIVSPRLSEEDIDAIEKGYDERDIVGKSLLRCFDEPNNYFESERLNLLANLIANEKLDIKVAFTKGQNQIGIYHEKMGLLYDKENNIIAFSGSTNETEMAFVKNYEVMDVFCSWQTEFEKKKVDEKEFAFHMLWTNADETVKIFDFPNIVKEKLQSYKKEFVNYNVDFEDVVKEKEEKPKNVFRKPDYIKFHDYQQCAIDKFISQDGQGIFDMATGSGKTYTGLGAMAELSEKLNDNLGVIIVCPYQHLVDQWVEDIRNFNVEPLICYSKYEWKKKFRMLLLDYKLGVIKNFCVIMANASFKLDYTQELLSKIKGNVCLVVDEAHNFGSQKLQECLIANYQYRLALSATIERHHDEEGTQAIYNFFGSKCIEFSLKDAIENDFLTPYHYHPIVVNLEEDELEEYNVLSDKIYNILRKCRKKDGEMPEAVKQYLIARARIVAGARQKLDKLEEYIIPHKLENNILVYCGATKSYDYESTNEGQDNECRQIEAVTNLLGNKLNMRVSMFTSKEKAEERERIKKSFAEGELLQALIAIRCLDEGVNIPGIRTAFILASSTNPKEYVQRRGRVLRKSDGKQSAVIYDFITIPYSMENRSQRKYTNGEISLIKREYERMENFAQLCENSSATLKLMDEIDKYYNLNYIGGNDYDI